MRGYLLQGLCRPQVRVGVALPAGRQTAALSRDVRGSVPDAHYRRRAAKLHARLSRHHQPGTLSLSVFGCRRIPGLAGINQAFGGRTCSRNTYVVRSCLWRRRKPTTASRSPNCASTRWSGRRSKPITSARGLRGTWTRFDIEQIGLGEEEEAYDGIPVSELRIDSVEWSPEQTDHIRTRSARYLDAF